MRKKIKRSRTIIKADELGNTVYFGERKHSEKNKSAKLELIVNSRDESGLPKDGNEVVGSKEFSASQVDLPKKKIRQKISLRESVRIKANKPLALFY